MSCYRPGEKCYEVTCGGNMEGYCQGKKERRVGIMEWILCSVRMPEEHKSIFARYKGTDKWNHAMFENTSDDVIVTCELEDGSHMVTVSHTNDGEWRIEKDISFTKKKVIAWMPIPENHFANADKKGRGKK